MAPVLKSTRSRIWMPVALFLVMGALTLILWKILVDGGQQRMRLETQVTAEQVKLRLEAWFDTRGAVVAHFADDWSLSQVHDGAEFTTRAESVVQLYSGFQALNFIDENWVIRFVVPLEPNRAALGKDLHDHPSAGVREAIAYAQENRTVHRTPLIQLLQGKPGFAAYAPVFRADGSLVGFINGVFGVDELVNSCLSEANFRERFQFRLMTPDGREAFKHYQGEFNEAGSWAEHLPVRLVDRPWILDIAFSPQGLATVDTKADEFLAAIGFGLSLLLAILLWAYLTRQAELNKEREQYRLLVENQADFLIKVDSEGRLVFVSPSFCRFTGRIDTDLQGVEFLDLVHDDDLPIAVALMSGTRTLPDRVGSDFRIKTPAGDIWTGWSVASFQGSRGEADGLVGVGRDISKRRELEAQLRQSQRLQAVGQLAGGIAHDFNNILQAIQGYIEFVMEDLPKGSESHEDLHQAKVASERAAVLVRQLLAFSRRQILKPVNLDLNQVIGGMMSMLKRVIGSSISIDYHPQEGLGLIKADQGQLEQILMNLAVNARDAMDAGGQITITTANEYADEEFCRRHQGNQAGPYVRLDFSDTGKGMGQEVLDKLFEPFFTTKGSGSGTGLGLSTVYGIIKQHDGMVLIESELGQGSHFTIYLPVVEGVLEAGTESRSQTPGQGQETVLFAEDEPLLRKLGVRIMGAAGYRVLVGNDGQEAWDLFLENEAAIDLAVLDVVMPKLGGRELAEKIRERKPDLGVIFVSGYDSEWANNRLEPLPRSMRLAKPYNRNDLLAVIRKVLDEAQLEDGSSTEDGDET